MPNYDLIVVGTGPASAFFLEGYLARAPANARVLVLEKGQHRTHAWRMENPEGRLLRESRATVRDTTRAHKTWKLGVALGGTSNLWWGCTPRFLPEDFELKTRFGIGHDWPLGYGDLERHYAHAEQVMGVSGDANDTPFERSTPYPTPPHALTEPEKLLKAAHPETFFRQPCARPSVKHGKRPACCANGVCGRCPIDSKFTVLNGFPTLFEDPRVTLTLGAAVQRVETQGGQARGVEYLVEGRARRAQGDLVALGANALFNPHILLRSGLEGPLVGRRLHEQASVRVSVHLDGVENFSGSTSITGHHYGLYSGEHRREHAAALIETWNVPSLRLTPGKWRQVMQCQVIFEDLPLEGNRVTVDAKDPTKPRIEFVRRSDYVERARVRALDDVTRAMSGLPVEKITVLHDGEFRKTEGHILGTTVMSATPDTGVVDRHLKHHQVRNLLVLGGSVFPSCAPANPTLTISALSAWAAANL